MTRQKVLSLPRISNRLGQLARFARSHGKLRALYSVASAVLDRCRLQKWLKFCVVEVFSVPVSELRIARRIPRAFAVRTASAEDLPALEMFFSDSSDPQRIRERFGRGDTCVVTVAQDEICAAVWFALGPQYYPEDWNDLGCIFHVPHGVAWSFDGKGTRLGAWGSLMGKLPQYLDQCGAKEVITLIDYNNRESLDAHKSLGYRRAGVICYFYSKVPGFALRLYKNHGRKWRLMPGQIGRLAFSGKKNATDFAAS